MKNIFTTGQLAKQADCNVETVRFYEQKGLMPEPSRTAGGHRVYNLSHVKRLHFIRRSRELGFNIEQVRELLKFIDEPDHNCGEVNVMATTQISTIEKKITDLQRLQRALSDMADRCQGSGYSINDCPIIDALYVDK
ncbi:MerR family transcriptional regulator [Methylophaga sp. OBS4]|uniref:MerR family transcriptional regulator n=1 Tax=Methylophaga sp. OBS4 TaxID=2991935 RepID=UPI002251FD7D|nr:helix-turn-helix domain-containing protein [Methylophaga sp. OBS4]MCX4186290.1 helix-turn-helix domain-containing protein [Methylophaga sp. OBS4]